MGGLPTALDGRCRSGMQPKDHLRLGYEGYWGYIGICWDHGKENGNYYIIGIYTGYIGIMENKMETIISQQFT